MVTKYIVLVLATIVLVQAASLKEVESSTEATSDVTTEADVVSTTVAATTTTVSPKDEASAIYSQLKSKVRGAIRESETAMKQVTWSAISFSANGTKNIEEAYMSYLGDIYSLKENYTSEGVDISKCIKQVEPALAKTKRYYLDLTRRAVVHEVDVIYNYYSLQTIRNLQNLWVTVHDLGTDLKQCGSDSECVNEVLSNLEKQSDVIPAKVDEYLAQLKQYQSGYTVEAENAIDARLTQFKIQANTDVEPLTTCIENLVNA